MDKFELQQLRELPIEAVAERLGLRVTQHKSLCPFHEDTHPSLSFRVNRNTCRCFVCMTQSIGPIDLVMRHLHIDFREACRWLSNGEIVSRAQEVQEVQEVRGKPFDATQYERYFVRPWLSPEARHFLFDERQISPQVVRWCRLTSWRDKQGTPWLQTPYYDREGRLVGVQNRRLERAREGQGVQEVRGVQEVQAPRFRFPQGSQCGIYNLPILKLLKPGDALYITEGCSDCWAMLSARKAAIAIPSATLLTRKDVELLTTLSSSLSLSFHMYPDRDEPGERLFLQLQKVLPTLVHHQLPQDCKDFSEYYLKMKIKGQE